MRGYRKHLRKALKAQFEVLVDVFCAHQIHQAIKDDLGIQPLEQRPFIPVLLDLVFDDPVEVGVPHVGQKHADIYDGDDRSANEQQGVRAKHETKGEKDDGDQGGEKSGQQDEDLCPDGFTL